MSKARAVICLILTPCSLPLWAQSQCTSSQLQSFYNQCVQYGSYVEGLEASCVVAYGSHDECGFYPLPSQVVPIAGGLACQVTWLESPSRGEGTSYSSLTANEYTLNCSLPPTIPQIPKNSGPAAPTPDSPSSPAVPPDGDGSTPPDSPCGGPADSSGSTDVGNPINIGVANKHQCEFDYVSSGMMPIRLSRTYNSTSSRRTTLGVGWTGTYDRSIRYVGNGVTGAGALNTALANRGDGKQYSFTQTGSTSPWVADADVHATLSTTGVDANGHPLGWLYVDDSGVVETYDASGWLQRITNRVGRSLTFIHGCASGATCPVGAPTAISDPSGRSVGLVYDSFGRLAQVTDAAGGTYKFAYSDNTLSANLTSLTYPDLSMRSYVYAETSNTSGANLPNALTGIIDENATRFATFTYDTSGHAISTQRAGGVALYSVAYQPDVNGNPSVANVTSPLGAVRGYGLGTMLGVVKGTSLAQPAGAGSSASSLAFAYDANGNVSSRVDYDGNLTCYAYDLTRNLETARVEGLVDCNA